MPKKKAKKPAITKTVKAVGRPAQPTVTNPLDLISQAVNNNVDIETLERLFALQREYKKDIAKEKFDRAMASFQSEVPIISKSQNGATTKTGQVAYKYAPLDKIVEVVKPLLKKYNLSYLIKTETGEKNVKAICIVKHIAGHEEKSEMQVPLGTKTEIMSMTQVVASALTFAKRYAFTNAFGILTGEPDNDANSVPKDEPKLGKKELKDKINSINNIEELVELFRNYAHEDKETIEMFAKRQAELQK